VTVSRSLRTGATRLAWIGIALVVALGGAGIVTAMSHVPGSSAPVDLTAAGDRVVGPALDAATDDLKALVDETDQLGSTARRALSLMVAGDATGLQAALTDGTLRLGQVRSRAAALDTALAAVPYPGDDWALHYSAVLRSRFEGLRGTAELTPGLMTGLEGDWASFTGRALDAATLSGLLARHDQETAAAAKQGSAAHYKQAIAGLAISDATIAQARGLRDHLAGGTDVTTLTSWIDRNAGYDQALRTLYQSLLDSKGRVTPAVRAAFDGEQQARAALPGDTRGMVVIMSDLAQGGLNQAVIGIEQARATLSDALDLQRQLKVQPQVPG
jgi:hypothetical protein